MSQLCPSLTGLCLILIKGSMLYVLQLSSPLEATMLEVKPTGWWSLSNRVGQDALQELSDTSPEKLVPPADVSS